MRSFLIGIYTLLLLTIVANAMGQDQNHFCTASYKTDVTSLRMRWVDTQGQVKTNRDGQPQRPFLLLDTRNTHYTTPSDKNLIEFSFDCLSQDLHQYSYTVYHLNQDFTRSELQSFEYLSGFTTDDITLYSFSNNTQQIYIHYQLFFPNEQMQLTKSGNYVLHIYEDGNPDNTVVNFCFQVVEPLVGIETDIRANTQEELNGRYQQLDIDIDTRMLTYNNPDDVKLVVQQNGRTDNQVINPKANYIEPFRFRYKNNRELIFEGGNEYRHFDAYSVYYAGYNVDRIRYAEGEYHAFLEYDQNRGVTSETERTGAPYIYEHDTNGQFVVNAENCFDIETEAEYMWVHWTLPMSAPFFDGTVYVSGELFHNQMNLHNRMQYDNEQKCYYLIAPFKQGAYDYQYWFLPKGEKKATLLKTEGSHWQTDNEYTVFVYFRPQGGRYDQLVGMRAFRGTAH